MENFLLQVLDWLVLFCKNPFKITSILGIAVLVFVLYYAIPPVFFWLIGSEG